MPQRVQQRLFTARSVRSAGRSGVARLDLGDISTSAFTAARLRWKCASATARSLESARAYSASPVGQPCTCPPDKMLDEM